MVLPSFPGELFLDIDTQAQLHTFERVRAVFLANGVEIVENKRTRSRGGNTHIYATVLNHDLSAADRICLQALLGSDPVREALSLLRVRDGQYPPTVFFEVPTNG